MEILPRTLGTRPRLACEFRAEGVVAARAEDATAVLSAVSRAPLAEVSALPQFRGTDATGAEVGLVTTGSVSAAAGRVELVASVRKALEAVSLRTRDVTLVVPDAAVRVLLLDFDSLPAKEAEALPVVRFRLKKLLPFDADDAAVSYQVMATSKGSLQVLAVAMPREVQAEYESVVREAGFEPGAILPSTLAVLAGLDESERPMLVVNAGLEGVTTAIVRGGVLLLHRTVDLSGGLVAEGANQAMVPEFVPLATVAVTHEVAQAVSVAAAYFEDTLETAPPLVLAAGTLGAEALTGLLDEAQVGPVAVQEILRRQMLGAEASSAGSPTGIPLGWLAGVRGALAN